MKMNVLFTMLVLLHSLTVAQAATTKQTQGLKIKSFAELQGQFTQIKTLQELDVKIKTEGKFKIKKSLDKNLLFIWSILKPSPSVVCIDSEGIQISANELNGKSDQKKKQIKFSEVSKETSDQVLNFFKLLSLDQESSENLFFIHQEGKSFLLAPKDPQTSLLRSVRIEVNRKGLIKNLLIEEKSSDKIQIQFLNLKTKDHLSKDEAHHFKCER